ncbi:VOC family protein [Granulicoccus sp. GXG6511]|uniref:VOC family protein n=1 Tax=Granulicoccus sp. GXG6511 TaxID=3381351 RepID=UPI003D7EB04E
MITAIHNLIYSDDATATRAFLRDVLRWPSVADSGDSGEPDAADWLIFSTGPSELGVHPTVSVHGGQEYRSERHHQISLMCDDLDATMAELRERGAEFAGEPADMGFGVGVNLKVPGADDMLLYEPRHAVAYDR